MPKLLTNKKKAWVGQFKPTAVLRGKPLNYNASIEEKYRAKMDKLINQMCDRTKKKLIALFKNHTISATDSFALDATLVAQAKILVNQLTLQFNELFGYQAKPISESMVKASNQASKSAVHQSLKELSGGLSLKTDFMSAPLAEVFTASVNESVGLIKSIPQKYFSDVQGSVMRSISNGNGLADLVPALEKYEGITKRRAKIIASDQTKKVYNGLNKGRMQKLGVDKYEWLHTGGASHPREEHIAMSGQIFSLSNPPVIDSKTGQTGKPGDLINCSCRMLPVIEFNNGEQNDE